MKDTNRKPYQPQDNPNTAYLDNDPTRLIIRNDPPPDGLAEAVQATSTAGPGNLVTLFYSKYDNAIITRHRPPGTMMLAPSLYEYITTTSKPLTADQILQDITVTMELSDNLPF